MKQTILPVSYTSAGFHQYGRTGPGIIREFYDMEKVFKIILWIIVSVTATSHVFQVLTYLKDLNISIGSTKMKHIDHIWFLETSGQSYLHPRALCSIESAAYHHALSRVTVFTTGQVPRDFAVKKLTKLYKNINFESIDSDNLLRGKNAPLPRGQIFSIFYFRNKIGNTYQCNPQK